jgi:hypothetical protein
MASRSAFDLALNVLVLVSPEQSGAGRQIGHGPTLDKPPTAPEIESDQPHVVDAAPVERAGFSAARTAP